MQEKITRQDVSEWKQHPVTLAWVAGIKVKIKGLKEMMAAGGTLNTESVDSTALQTAKTAGHIEGLQDVLQIDETNVIEE